MRTALAERVRRELASAYGGVAGSVLSHVREGTTIWERDWDVLCVLDACRLDLMREVCADDAYGFLPAPNEVGDLWSVASQSAEWMDRTFAPAYREEMARTAYVTGNPFTGQTAEWMDELSGEALPLAGEDFGLLYEAWRDEWTHGEISTMPPRPLTDAAIHVWRERQALGVDRVLVHYMQPHAPFRSRPDWFYGDADLDGWGSISGEAGGIGEGLWQKLREGTHAFDAFWGAYRDNLEWVLDDVSLLVENCEGSVVLSADHGNGHGEWGVWSHPPGVAVPALRRVPWVEVTARDSRTYDPDPPDGLAASDAPESPEAGVEARLADLGYR